MAYKNVGLPFPPKRKAGMPPPDFGPKRKGIAVEETTVAKAEPVPGGLAVKPVAKEVKIEAGPRRGPSVDEPPFDAPELGEPSGDAIPPEAVCFRSAMESCGNCMHNEGGNCSRLQIPVEENDSCNLFADRGGEDEEEEPGMPLTSRGMDEEEAPF